MHKLKKLNAHHLKFCLYLKIRSYSALAVFIDPVDSESDDMENFPFTFTIPGPEKWIQAVLISYSASNW